MILRRKLSFFPYPLHINITDDVISFNESVDGMINEPGSIP